MRTISEEVAENKFGEDYAENDLVKSADHRESIGTVLASIDAQLLDYGLEVVQVETGSDTYYWYIDVLERE